jgi:hypothetical protein
MLTTTLWNGVEVAAKLYKGEPSAIPYANRTQAKSGAAKLGAGWDVFQFSGRPFYVGRTKETAKPAMCVECGASPAVSNGRCDPCSMCVASQEA